MINRKLYIQAWHDLASAKPMVFLAGPRQSGKTTLAQTVASEFQTSYYFNWDYVADRKRLLAEPDWLERLPRQPGGAPLIILDEIHKYRRWKTYVKGLYDVFHNRCRFLVSGSGRLDIYQRGGDSLAGRYEMLHLWPLTLAELCPATSRQDFLNNPLTAVSGGSSQDRDSWHALMQCSGFPEPFLAGSVNRWRRWSRAYGRQLIREDIRDLAHLKELDLFETLHELLPDRVGSPLSLNGLAKLLQVSYNTVKAWMQLLQRFYLVFSISPWSKRISRGLRKEQKVYLFDIPRISDETFRFENAVALELHRAIHFWNDLGIGDFGLHYVRNKEKEEVDFLIARDRQPWLLVEAKSAEPKPAKALRRFQDQLGVPAVQLTDVPGPVKLYPNGELEILVAPAWKWLPQLA
jgi:predicted AAA+ superfamily ATPase